MGRHECPARDDLIAFNLGLLPEERIEAVGRHIDECSSCRHDLALMADSNGLGVMRKDGANSTLEAGLAQAIALIRNLGPSSTQPRTAHDAAAADDVSELLTPPQQPGELGRLGPYRVFEVIGTGGMGVVFRGEDSRLGRIVALKVLRPHTARLPGMAERLVREARTVAAVAHDHIVPIYEIGEANGRPFLSMAFIARRSLARELHLRPLEPRRAARLIREASDAIHFAHSLGVVHRDLKPGNILIDRDDRARITDFGLAKPSEAGDNLTQPGQVMGTPNFMPPEQAQGGAVGPLADVYSLGATLYCLLTGRPPFQSASPLETLNQVVERDPVAPRQLNPSVPRDLETICLKCLEKAPARRYRSAAALAEELGRYLEGRPIQARPVGTAGHAIRWARRNPALATLTTFLVLLVIGVTIVSAVSAFYFDRLADREAEQRRARERTIVDMYTASGLHAAADGETRQAMVWFAEAARLAGDDVERSDANRIRAAAWSRRAMRPVAAVLHPDPIVHRVALHPGGRYLLTEGLHPARRSSSTRVWDLERETELEFSGRVEPITAAAWNPAGDVMALGGPSGVEFRRFPGGEVIHRATCSDPVQGVRFSDDGRWCAIGSGNQARVWDCGAAAFATPSLAHPAPVATMAFSSSGDLLATGCGEGTARVFSIPDGALLVGPVPHRGRDAPIVNAAPMPPIFVAQGRRLVTLANGVATWRDARTGQPISTAARDEDDRGGPFSTAALSDDGAHLLLAAAGNESPAVRMYDAATGEPRSVNLDHRRSRWVFGAAFSPDGRMLATACGDHMARLWSVPEGKPLGEPLAHPAMVSAVAWSADGRRLVTGQQGGLIRVWALPTGDAADRQVPMGGATFAKTTRDGRFVVAAGHTRRIGSLRRTRVFDIATGQPAGPELDAGGLILDAVFSPDDAQLAIAASSATTRHDRMTRERDMTGTVARFDWRTGKQLSAPIALPSEARSLDFRPDGEELAVLGAGGELVVIDARTGKERLRWQTDPARAMATANHFNSAVRYCPDGRHLLTFATRSNAVRVWNAANGSPVRELPLDDRCHDLTFSPNGRLVATASDDNQARVWDLATGERLVELPHPFRVISVRFSPDGRLLLTGCRDAQARVWDWRTRTLVCPPCVHNTDVGKVVFTPDGRLVISVSSAGETRIWEWRTGKLIGPPLTLDGGGHGLTVTPDGQHLVAGGLPGTLSIVRLGDWLTPLALPADELSTWAEIVAGQRIEVGGGVTNLTTEEWLERWQPFRRRHPELTDRVRP